MHTSLDLLIMTKSKTIHGGFMKVESQGLAFKQSQNHSNNVWMLNIDLISEVYTMFIQCFHFKVKA